jgi:penicillin-binding protein 2
LFVSFAPFDDPRIAVAVIVENGRSGSGVAAPIAKAVMDQYLGYGANATE